MRAGAPKLLSALAVAFHLGITPAAEDAADDLRALRERINRLQRELAHSTEKRAGASDELRAAETAISAADRQLRRLDAQHAAANADLRDIERQSRGVAVRTEAQKRQLAALLYRQGTGGGQDALRLLLGGSDPNQAARDRHYLIRLSQAEARMLTGLRQTLAEQQQLAAKAREKSTELAEIRRKQAGERKRLLARQKQRQQVLARISDKIKAQRREIGTLKANEARLSKLIEGLGRVVRKPGPRPSAKPGTSALSNRATPEPSSFHGNFATLRGKLRLPVKGEIANRFGTARGEGGLTWKGIFIRTHEGTEVKAVAPGRVVFADWLRGFGNLLIIDHGDGFMTIYGYNQSLLHDTGDEVRTGDAVAAVGSSGGSEESGLYFELRQQGQPVDPLKWASLR